MSDAIVSAFVAEQKELLALELQADEKHDDEDRSANYLGNLEVSDVSVGLFGRTVVQLILVSHDASSMIKAILPAHRMTVGDEVEIQSKQKSKNGFPGGVVCEVAETHVAVALFTKSAAGSENKPKEGSDEPDEFGSPPLTLLPRSSVEVNRKLMNALTTLGKHGSNHPVAGQMIQAMFCRVSFPPFVASPFDPFNKHLDDSQMEAISFKHILDSFKLDEQLLEIEMKVCRRHVIQQNDVRGHIQSTSFSLQLMNGLRKLECYITLFLKCLNAFHGKTL